jgi:hypothetical protein
VRSQSASHAPRRTCSMKPGVGRSTAIRLSTTLSPSFDDAGRGYNGVQNVRGKGERRLDDALAALASALRATRAPWMVIGGIAVIARGVRRMTTDIDVVVRGDAVDTRSLLRTLLRFGIRPRIDRAEEFAQENLVLLLRHTSSGVDLDLSLGWTAFEQDAIAACTKATYGHAAFPMARAEDLVVFKAMAARPKDVEDAAALILKHPDIDTVTVRRRLVELATLAEEPSLIEGFDRVLVRAQSVRSSARRRRASAAATQSKTSKRRPTPQRTKKR